MPDPSEPVGSGAPPLDPISLRFVDDEVEREYLRDAFADYARPLRLALVVGVALFALYAFVDLYLFGHFVREMLVIRAIVCGLGVGLLALTYRRSFGRLIRPSMSLLHMTAGLAMLRFSMLHPSYTGGVYAVLMFFALLARAQFRFSMLINVVMLFCIGWLGARPEEGAAALVNLSMFFSAVVVIGLGAYVKERSDRMGFVQKRAVATARDQALAASRAKSTFLANMSHELRTPLNAIIGYGEMLQEDVEEAGLTSSVADLAKVVSSGRHLLGLINDILDLSKIEAGKIELLAEEIDIAALVRAVAATVTPLVKRNGNTLHLELAPDLGHMVSDSTRVRQILYNLLSNASKFTRGGSISLSASREASGTVVFIVRDTGIGMTPDQRQRIFDAFSQGDASTTRDFGGTGLGLTISLHFARLLGGQITVESEPGRGSTFTVTVPAELPRRPPVAQ